MKYLKTYQIFESNQILTRNQIDFLDSLQLARDEWEINTETGLVDVHVGISYDHQRPKMNNFAGIKFGHIKGSFSVIDNNITSLEGAPHTVDGFFDVSNNILTSLAGGPKIVKRDYNCTDNKLTSLEGVPEEVGGEFNCSRNYITSFKGGPKICGGTYFSLENSDLISLEGFPKNYQSFEMSTEDKHLDLIFSYLINKMNDGFDYWTSLFLLKDTIHTISKNAGKDYWEILDKSGLDSIKTNTLSGAKLISKLT